MRLFNFYHILLTCYLLILVTVSSNGQNTFVNCIGCDVEDSIHFYPANSIVMNGGINEVVEGLIMVPYNAKDYKTDKFFSGVKYLGLETGQEKHDFLIDTTGKLVVNYCMRRDDSTSFLAGYYNVVSGTGVNQDTSVAWIGIIDHNDLSFTEMQTFQYPNSRATYFSGLIYNPDSSITAIGRIVTPYNNYGKNIKYEIAADLSSSSVIMYHSNNFPSSISPIRTGPVHRLTNGNIIYSGSFGCDQPYLNGDNVGIEEITPSTFSNWSYDYQACNFHGQALTLLTLEDNSFYAVRQVNDSTYSTIVKSHLEFTYFSSGKIILNSFNIQTSDEMNTIVCSPVLDSDSNLVCLLGVSDSLITGLDANYPIGRVVKLDRQGNILWYKDINYFDDENGTRSMREWMNSLSILPNDDLIVSGRIIKGGNTNLPAHQDNYIIVERISADGCSEDGCANYYSESEEIQVSEFKCYPNPTNGIVHVLLENNVDNIIIIQDVYGRVLKHFESNSGSQEIDLSSFVNGIYFCSVIYGNHRNTQKIILNK